MQSGKKRLTIAIDFDGVLHDYLHPVEGRRMGNPIQGSLNALKALHDDEHTIIIFTCRGERPDHIADWLKYFGFAKYYDAITDHKPEADIYLDDRAIRFTNWLTALGDIHFRIEWGIFN